MEISIRKKLGRRIKELRKKHRMTQEDLAEKAALAYKHVQRLEGKNPNAVKIDTLEKLANAFGITISKLLSF